MYYVLIILRPDAQEKGKGLNIRSFLTRDEALSVAEQEFGVKPDQWDRPGEKWSFISSDTTKLFSHPVKS